MKKIMTTFLGMIFLAPWAFSTDVDDTISTKLPVPNLSFIKEDLTHSAPSKYTNHKPESTFKDSKQRLFENLTKLVEDHTIEVYQCGVQGSTENLVSSIVDKVTFDELTRLHGLSVDIENALSTDETQKRALINSYERENKVIFEPTQEPNFFLFSDFLEMQMIRFQPTREPIVGRKTNRKLDFSSQGPAKRKKDN